MLLGNTLTMDIQCSTY